MSVITVEHLTKDYGYGRGVFNVSMQIEQGECYGFLGPNGAGKTTTIRHLMGFSKPQIGRTSIAGMDSWQYSAQLQHLVGYLPGEVTLPESSNGVGFLRMMEKMRRVRDPGRLDMLLERFELDPDIRIKEMSLGVKRKLAVVTAFMHDPDILILDEPTSGLDPVMQENFIDFVKEEKKRGKTIFLSSHIFHEVDACCDRIAIIRDGQVVSEFQAEELKQEQDKVYTITLGDDPSYEALSQGPWKVQSENEISRQVRLQLPEAEVGDLLQCLADLDVADLVETPFTLEDYFMGFYTIEHHYEGVK